MTQYYIDKDGDKDDKDDNLLLDDESLKRELDEIIRETSNEKTEKDKSSKDKKDKSLKHKIKSEALKTITNTLTGQGLNFNRIKIDENLLKKNILKVRYINSNLKINNKFLKEDYQISDNVKNSILKSTGLNKLSKNEYDVYNTLQKYRKKR